MKRKVIGEESILCRYSLEQPLGHPSNASTTIVGARSQSQKQLFQFYDIGLWFLTRPAVRSHTFTLQSCPAVARAQRAAGFRRTAVTGSPARLCCRFWSAEEKRATSSVSINEYFVGVAC
jgi:hypothetical protein